MPKSLALMGGEAVCGAELMSRHHPSLLWPIYTGEDEGAVLSVMRDRQMSGTEITKVFEKEYAAYVGSRYALGYCNGTASLHAALWACGVGAGDEVICPSLTYWASCAAVLSLGAAVHFADIDAETLCLDPGDIEHRIGSRTRAIIVVHYLGYPAAMDEIMAIARRHDIKVIEDASHSHGAHYKGRMTGTIGDIAGQSMMTGKSFAIGEAGMIFTDNRALYERCISYGHYERTGIRNNFNSSERSISDAGLIEYAGVPLGGRKDRMNQWCSALGRVQLKYFPERVREIEAAMQYFCNQLDEIPGLWTHRPPAGSGLDKGAWYSPACHYQSDLLHGLPLSKFLDAVRAENLPIGAFPNFPLHLHPVFTQADLFHQGKPTAIAFGQRDVSQPAGALPVSEQTPGRCFILPRFSKYDRGLIDLYVRGIRKVVDHHQELL